MAGVLTREQILEAAEETLRRFGPAKTTVVDVARTLGVSHGTVYRHFPSKAALRDAVAEEWLARVSAPLEAIVASGGPALGRLHDWVATLSATKRGLAAEDPELFETYVTLAVQSREVVDRHVDELVAQLTAIVAAGVDAGELVAADPAATARAIFDATSRFHNPVHAGEWADAGLADAFEAVWSLLIDGLRPRRG